jgi:type IV secretion system protein TrbI
MSETPVPLRPEPPTPRRLNSFALVLLSLAGAVLLATVVYFVSQRPTPPARSTPAAPPPRSDAESFEPGFLRRPPRPTPQPALPPQPAASDPSELAALDALSRAPQGGGEPGPGGAPPGAYPLAAGSPSPSFGISSPPPSPPSDPRREAYQRALRAPISISAPPGVGASLSGGPAAASLPALPALRIPGLTEALTDSTSRESPPPREDPTTAFLTAARTPRDSRLALRIDPPNSSTQLDAGSLIPAVLATGINSDLPGDLLAQVSRDVFDSRTERLLLIPRGSRLLGRYQNQVATGDRRLLVAWDRLIFPDGTSLRFPGLPATATSGESGLPASVDNHLPTVFGSALLLSLLSAGVQLSQPQESATFGQAASARQVGAAALGQELSTVATELLRRRLAIAPTLRIPAGTEFNVFVRGDLALPLYRR